MLFVIRMFLLSWELGADEIISLQASHKCVSLAQMPIPYSQSHWNPVLHTRTQTNTWASAPPLNPHFSQTFARFSPFLNLASAHHHRDLELAPMVARQQWLEAFSLNYVHVSQVYILCCKPLLLTAVLISINKVSGFLASTVSIYIGLFVTLFIFISLQMCFLSFVILAGAASYALNIHTNIS